MSKELPWQYWLKPTQSNNTVAVGVCNSYNGEELKVTTLSAEFNLYEGCLVLVFFTYSLQGKGLTMNINGTGSYPVVTESNRNLSNTNNYNYFNCDLLQYPCVFVFFKNRWVSISPIMAYRTDVPGIVTLSDSHATTNSAASANNGNYCAASSYGLSMAYKELYDMITDLDDRVSSLGG